MFESYELRRNGPYLRVILPDVLPPDWTPLARDLELELEAVDQLKGAIAHCESVLDFTSRELFAKILTNEEDHVDHLEQQFEMIAAMGLQNYVQLQSKPAEA